MPPTPDITLLLQKAEAGGPGAMDHLMEAVYADLKRMAERHMGQHFGPGLPGVTLEPAALVNESFLKLVKQRNAYVNRQHFFAIATRVMLRVLVDYQRSRSASKRGGDRRQMTISLDGPAQPPEGPGPRTEIAVASLADALQRLEALDSRKADVVKLRVVWGLQIEEIARTLDLSASTVKRDWQFAKAWLADEVSHSREGVA